MEDDELVLLPDAARELGISHVTAWRYVKAKRLTAHKLGPMYVIRRKDLDAFKAKSRPVGRPRKPP